MNTPNRAAEYTNYFSYIYLSCVVVSDDGLQPYFVPEILSPLQIIAKLSSWFRVQIVKDNITYFFSLRRNMLFFLLFLSLSFPLRSISITWVISPLVRLLSYLVYFNLILFHYPMPRRKKTRTHNISFQNSLHASAWPFLRNMKPRGTACSSRGERPTQPKKLG